LIHVVNSWHQRRSLLHHFILAP